MLHFLLETLDDVPQAIPATRLLCVIQGSGLQAVQAQAPPCQSSSHTTV
jgi:hypothetical protein